MQERMVFKMQTSQLLKEIEEMREILKSYRAGDKNSPISSGDLSEKGKKIREIIKEILATHWLKITVKEEWEDSRETKPETKVLKSIGDFYLPDLLYFHNKKGKSEIDCLRYIHIRFITSIEEFSE